LDWNFTEIGEEKIRRVSSLKLGTWNVRTLNKLTTGKEELLEKECKKFNMNFVGLTETKWKGPGGHYYTHEGSLLMHSEAENCEHGVGAIVDKWTVKKVIGYEGISDRIMIVRLAAYHTMSPSASSTHPPQHTQMLKWRFSTRHMFHYRGFQCQGWKDSSK